VLWVKPGNVMAEGGVSRLGESLREAGNWREHFCGRHSSPNAIGLDLAKSPSRDIGRLMTERNPNGRAERDGMQSYIARAVQ